MVGHTKGPWVAASAFSSIVGVPVVARSGKSIANTARFPEMLAHDPEGRAEALANARLIAAAPDLVDALGDVLRILDAVKLSAGLGKKQIERMDKARAALRLASGEES